MLRREAEALILPNLPAFLRGEYQPQDNDERLALLAAQLASCEFEGLQGAAARLYFDAFAAVPTLADDVLAANCYHAACAAALAGCGQGKDADQLNDEERAVLRRQALDWLRQDLTWCGQRLDDGNGQTNARIGRGCNSGAAILTWPASAPRTPSPGCRTRNASSGSASGPTWTRCSDACACPNESLPHGFRDSRGLKDRAKDEGPHDGRRPLLTARHSTIDKPPGRVW